MHEVIYEKLQEVARAKSITNYTEIGSLVGLEPHNPILWGMLDDINRYEHQQNHPMLSAVVVLKNKYIPDEGFFPLARELGRFRGSDKDTFWINELKEVHNHWSSH